MGTNGFPAAVACVPAKGLLVACVPEDKQPVLGQMTVPLLTRIALYYSPALTGTRRSKCN